MQKPVLAEVASKKWLFMKEEGQDCVYLVAELLQ